MAEFQPFNLGQVFMTAEGIKAARAQSTTDRLREQYLGEQIETMRSDRQRQARMDEITLGKDKAKQVYSSMQFALQSPNPKNFIEQNFPELVTNLQKNGVAWENLDDNAVKQMAQGVMAKAGAEIGADPGALSEREKFQMQSDLETKRISGQQQFQRTMQEDQQQFSAGQGAQNRQAQLDAEQRRQAFEAEQRRLDREARAVAKSPNSQQAVAERQRTLNVYTEARNGLIEAMGATDTGPIAGRTPALTAAQQTAEGAVAAMAPVLKQMFRSAGEGTFTDKDQELLLRMVPTRTDRPEARKAKLENIDGIISAKLGLPVPGYQPRSEAPQQPTGAPTQISSDADYDALPSGTVFIAPDGTQRRKP